MDRTVSVIVPVFNEAAGLRRFHDALKSIVAKLPYKTEIVYINDGSRDETGKILAEIRAQDSTAAYLTLSRNFGHQAALTAGLENVDSDVVIMMDGDGQHPPELIPEMLRLYEAGFDIVQTQRSDQGQTGLKGWTSRGFYWFIRQVGEVEIAPGAADFRLISRDVLHALQSMKEYHRFLRGMTSWLGFRTAILPYEAAARVAGKTRYSIRGMLRLAGDGLFSFSLVPLRLGIVAGCLFLVLVVAEICYVASFWLFRDPKSLVPGWSSIILMLTLGHGITMILLGFIGIYIGMIFQEVKRRPVYVINPSQSAAERVRAMKQDGGC